MSLAAAGGGTATNGAAQGAAPTVWGRVAAARARVVPVAITALLERFILHGVFFYGETNTLVNHPIAADNYLSRAFLSEGVSQLTQHKLGDGPHIDVPVLVRGRDTLGGRRNCDGEPGENGGNGSNGKFHLEGRGFVDCLIAKRTKISRSLLILAGGTR